MLPKRMLLLGALLDGPQDRQKLTALFSAGPLAASAAGETGWLDAELAALDSAGLIHVSHSPGHAAPAFGLTVLGRQALQEALQTAWEASAEPLSTQEIAALLARALDPDAYITSLQQRLSGLQQTLAQLEREATERQDSPLQDWPHVASRAIERLRAEMAWIEQLLGRVRATAALAAATVATAPMVAQPQAQPKRADGPAVGAFTFVLHSHLPYCRKAGRWPHGEEWLHEAMAETYIPLLDALYDLRAEGVPFRLTLGLTPILTEQLADPDVIEHFQLYLEEEIEAAESDMVRFETDGGGQLLYLACFYRDLYAQIRSSFVERYGSNLVAAFRQLQDEGSIEIITSAATHGYLPLLSRDSSIYGQLRAGVESYKRHFGRAPRAIWLPECAYRPAYVSTSGVTRPALEEFLAAQGITCFFVETHAIEGGRPVGKAAGDVAIGPYASIRRRYVVPVSETPVQGGSTYSAYHVVGSDRGVTEPPVAAIGRNDRTGQQVWAADWGYPGEADYREFHKKDHESGLQYWRVTGAGANLGSKDLYHPDWAEPKVAQHAQHYAALVERLLQAHHGETGRYGMVASNYDTELFGHWWFEGVEWIKQTLRALAAMGSVELTTASAYLDAHPPELAMAVPESSWGAGGNHWTWDNPETRWMWEPIHEAESRMEALVAQRRANAGAESAALDQAARELLLAESSDWPFLVTTGQAKQYAIERFQSHLSRFHRLADLIAAERLADAEALANEYYELDKVFPDIDPAWFAARQGRAD